MSKWNLRSISLVAYGIFGIGIVCNMTFYSGFGNGSSSLIYAIISLLFDLAKVYRSLTIKRWLRQRSQNHHNITTSSKLRQLCV
jgi:hypothetical protein